MTKYALEKEGPKRLEVAKRGAEYVVRFDDTEVEVVTETEVKGHTTVALPDGSSLELHLEQRGALGRQLELVLLRNGMPLPGSSTDPIERAKQGAYVLFFIAGLNFLCGSVVLLGDVQFLEEAGVGIGSFVMAAIFGVLGFFTMRGSRLALGLAMGLYALDYIAGVVLSIEAGQTPGVGGIFIRFVFLSAMWRSFQGMQQYDTE